MIQHIVALGGGGFSIEPDNPVVDRYILDLTGKDQPKVCFLPQATAESELYVVKFYDAFLGYGAQPSWLSLFGSVPTDYAETLLQSDVIYVGGGNTRSMLALWREWNLDTILKQAYENGTVLAGVSAGAICWFEECVTDSVSPLGSMTGLGYLKGSACPHYDGEADRRPTVHRMIAEETIMPCIAMQDYSAVHYVDGELHQVIASKPQARAYQVALQDGEVIETELLPRTVL